jgi:uncharacterized protein YceK
MKRRLLAAAAALLLAGCGSIADIATDQRIYGGIQKDVELIGHPYLPRTEPPEYFFPLIFFGLLDIPLSFCVDTVLLPVTITISLTSSDEKSR